ncbi:tautomerase family protein [Silvibacterium dinghuense]|uniref:Tautomerase family protein n=1 Tax=Silvibacterium dinghuense TaxID=1560006 RepID=A0A4Q1S8N5_9BACT|nr:tautomerase family protein [Silvibacterium dinghuense]RXS93332.1 tautomerase family protein [Silvibacterium dinghuense]GGH04970.1 putative 4-oxalocrotonate tautomerase [Silvibacterium dinghuense]
MPLVRVSVHDTMAPERRRKIPHAVYDAMRATINIPENDLFVVLTAHAEGELVIDPHFMGMQRTSAFTLVHITMRRGRTLEMKQALYKEIAARLHEHAAIPADDVMIVISENELLDWSFGHGVASYVSGDNVPSGLHPAVPSVGGER